MQTMTKHLRATSILSAACVGLAATVGAGVAHATVDAPQVKYEISGSSPVASYLSFQTDLGQQQSTSAIAGSLGQRHLTRFQSYVVDEFAAQYLCPRQLPHALTDLRNTLVGGS